MIQPKDLYEAVDLLLESMGPGTANVLHESTEREFIAIAHHTHGLSIRNNWFLWWNERDQEFNDKPELYPQSKPAIVQFFHNLGITNADDMSGIILTTLYRKFHGLPVDLQGQVQKYKETEVVGVAERVAENSLTKAELERLAILSEECAEVQQVIGKIIRHGYSSYNPFDKDRTSNRHLLEKELGDLMLAIALVARRDDVDLDTMEEHSARKAENIQKYLHHNTTADLL